MHNLSPVIIVDDDQGAADSVEALIVSHGFTAQVFHSAEQFLSDCNLDTSGCLIVDVRLPEMSGLELQDTLISRGIRIPTIFVSGHADHELKKRVLDHGAIDFLEKPFSGVQLLDIVRRVLSSPS